MDISYVAERYTAELPMGAYFRTYVDIPRFLTYCMACYHYEKSWSCPPYAFEVEAFWKKFERIKVVGVKILFDPELAEKKYTRKEIKEITNGCLAKEKDRLSRELLAEEEKYSGSVSLSAGNCSICGKDNCTKSIGDECRCPESMRFSIEALGGDVGKTVKELLGFELKWASETRLPEYFTLVGALLF